MAEMGQRRGLLHQRLWFNMPQIFTKETLRASKSMLVEEPFIPIIDRQDRTKCSRASSSPMPRC